jgi:hypothetical protein
VLNWNMVDRALLSCQRHCKLFSTPAWIELSKI